MSDEQDRVGAFVDDEMTFEEAEAFARALTADPALARQVDIQTRLRGRLKGAYGARLQSPPPDAVMRLLQEPRPVVVPLRPRPWMRIGVPAGMGFALAASIAIAIGLSQGGGDVAFSKSGVMVARGGLAQALDHRLGTDADPKARVQLVESFRTADGRYCRIFRTRSAAQSSGLACKDAEGWTIAALAAPARREASDFRQAGSDLPRPLVAAMGDLDLTQPLSASEESAARAGGWSASRPVR